MNELLFIRHGATAGNLEKRYIGRTDAPLCETGIAQVLALRERLPFAPGRLFASPMLRARQTAELLFPGMPYTVADGLREIDFGDFEGRTADEMSDDPAYRAWVEAGCAPPVPGGEDPAAFKRRCAAAFAAALRAAGEGERLAFVVHGGTVMAVMEAYARPARGFYDTRIGPGEFLRCRYMDGAIETEQRFTQG